jgi:hypothetical protein
LPYRNWSEPALRPPLLSSRSAGAANVQTQPAGIALRERAYKRAEHLADEALAVDTIDSGYGGVNPGVDGILTALER